MNTLAVCVHALDLRSVCTEVMKPTSALAKGYF